MELAIDSLLFSFAIPTVWVAIVLVLRTEKELDRFSKWVLLTSVVLFISSFLKLDKHFGIFSKSYSDNIFYGARLFNAIFYLGALVVMLDITKKKK